MKITYNWLKQYVDYKGSPEELGDQLTILGLKVESLERVGGGFDGVVVAERGLFAADSRTRVFSG